MVREGLARGLVFLTDEDARPEGAASPLRPSLGQRRGPGGGAAAGARGAPHRPRPLRRAQHRPGPAPGPAQRGAGAALLPSPLPARRRAPRWSAGSQYTYALRGDGQPPSKPVDGKRAAAGARGGPGGAVAGGPGPAGARHRPAAAAPRRVPAERGDVHRADRARRSIRSRAAATAADMAVRLLLRPERTARLVDFHRRDPSLPGLEEVLSAMEDKAFGGAAPRGRTGLAELRRAVQWVVVRRLIGLSSDPQAAPGVRSRVDAELASLPATLGRAGGEIAEAAHRAFLAREIGRYLDRQGPGDPAKLPEPPAPPPGQPIGMPDPGFLEVGTGARGAGDSGHGPKTPTSKTSPSPAGPPRPCRAGRWPIMPAMAALILGLGRALALPVAPRPGRRRGVSPSEVQAAAAAIARRPGAADGEDPLDPAPRSRRPSPRGCSRTAARCSRARASTASPACAR